MRGSGQPAASTPIAATPAEKLRDLNGAVSHHHSIFSPLEGGNTEPTVREACTSLRQVRAPHFWQMGTWGGLKYPQRGQLAILVRCWRFAGWLDEWVSRWMSW